MWNNLLLVLIGLSAGCIVSAGIFAFLTAIACCSAWREDLHCVKSQTL